MFYSRFLLVYVLLNVYVYFRIKSLVTSTAFKVIFTLFYVLLALAFPVTDSLAHGSGFAGSRYFLLFGFYSLPYLLYLFLTVLSIDIMLGLNHLLKIVPGKITRGRRFRSSQFGLLLILPLIVVIIGMANYNHIKINTYQIQVPRKSSALEHLKIALVADFHLGELTSRQFMPGFIGKINALAPDIVLIPGDILEGDRPDEGTAELAAQFRQIRTKYGVYASPGNHEYHGGSSGVNFFKAANIQLLQDAVTLIDNAFYLAGRNDNHRRSRKTIAELLGDVPGNVPILLLDHRPTGLEELSRSPVDIQFSAHTHHGQLFPLNFITKKQYELSWGYKKIGQAHVFVTCGIQGWGPPVKTAGRSEIMLIDVDLVKD